MDNATKLKIARGAVKAGALRRVPKVPAMEFRPKGARHSILRDKRSVTHHYNLSNEYFSLFLDESMTYSCAIWSRGAQTLEEAQFTKLELVCTKLGLQPGMRVLDVGCGWGAFAIHAAREHGVHVTGITLSEPQAQLARERAAAAGLADQVDIRVMDYRESAAERGSRLRRRRGRDVRRDRVDRHGRARRLGERRRLHGEVGLAAHAWRDAAQPRHRAAARRRRRGRPVLGAVRVARTPRRCISPASRPRSSAPACTPATSRTSRTTTRARCSSGSTASRPTSTVRGSSAGTSACASGASTCGCPVRASKVDSYPSIK